MPRVPKSPLPDIWDGLESFRATLPQYRQQEKYHFLSYQWDIVRAFYLIEQRPRDPQPIHVAPCARNYGFSFFEGGAKEEETVEATGFFYVNIKTVMSDEIDLERPLLIALVKLKKDEQPAAMLIDGLHRLFKAARQGRKELPALILTPEEELLCRC
jgi:hypothetical protein